MKTGLEVNVTRHGRGVPMHQYAEDFSAAPVYLLGQINRLSAHSSEDAATAAAHSANVFAISTCMIQ